MSLIRLEKISKAFSAEPILEDVDLRIEHGEKVGLIGRNGAGKSTLFRIITGEMDPDSGKVERMKKAKMACLSQFPDIETSKTIHHVALDQFADLIRMEHELRDLEEKIAAGSEEALETYSHVQDTFMVRGGYEFRHTIDRVLTGLGFTAADFGLPVSALSGGQRTRLMLALVLLEDADLLLLDEPENHLDLEAREWLENFLKDWPRTFVIVSHDRHMLNSVATRIIEVEACAARSYTGNYDRYVQEKALLREQQQKAFDRQQEFLEKEERLISRFRYKSTKARMVQSRIKRLEKIERIDAPEAEASSADFGLGEIVRSGAVMLEARGLSMGYDGLPLYSDVTFDVQRGERVGIIGPNGAGKSTLLRHIAGTLGAGTGAVTLGHKVRLGYYDQHHETLNPARDILSDVAECRPDLKPEAIRSFMGRFLFTGQDVFQVIETLSGGERARVSIAKLILEGANLLLLDEPTNHLDLASREALESALTQYPGSILLVSHDRALIDRLVDKLVIVENGKATVHPGNYTHYRWKAGMDKARAAEERDDSVMKIRRTEAAAPVKESKEQSKERERERRRQRRYLEELEERIAAMEEHIKDYDKRFTETDPSDFEALRRMQSDYDGLKADLREMYGEWEELAGETAQS